MSPCLRWPCTCWHMTSSTSVTCAAKRSAARGCSRATCAPTQARNRSGARTVGRHLLTAQTCALTCRHIRPSNTTSANGVTRRLRSRVTWISTMSPHASRGRSPLWAHWGNDGCLRFIFFISIWFYLSHNPLFFSTQDCECNKREMFSLFEVHEANDKNRLKSH